MEREELVKSPAYWTNLIQNELYRQIESFMSEKKMSKSALAEYLGCTSGYVTQLLSGNFDHKLSKLVELSLAIGKVPNVRFDDVEHVDESAKYEGTMRFSFGMNKQYDCMSDCYDEKAA